MYRVESLTHGKGAVDGATTKGAVYRISPDGVWDQLWESRDDAPYDLTFDHNGALIVGTPSTSPLILMPSHFALSCNGSTGRTPISAVSAAR